MPSENKHHTVDKNKQINNQLINIFFLYDSGDFRSRFSKTLYSMYDRRVFLDPQFQKKKTFINQNERSFMKITTLIYENFGIM